MTSDECYTPSNVQINSFKVGNLAATKDLAVQTETLQLSSYRDRAQNSPYAVELRFPHGFVGITLRTSAIGLSLGAAAAGCYQVKTGDPIAIVGCVASALTALMSAIGSKELAKKGTDCLARAGAKLGMFLDVKRATIDEVYSTSTAPGTHSNMLMVFSRSPLILCTTPTLEMGPLTSGSLRGTRLGVCRLAQCTRSSFRTGNTTSHHTCQVVRD